MNGSCFYKWFEIYSIYEIWFSIQMNRKVPKKRFCIPKQATIADRGYEVFTQESSRSSPRPGGSQKKEVRSKDPGEIISDLSLVFFVKFWFFLLLFFNEIIYGYVVFCFQSLTSELKTSMMICRKGLVHR
jgi:hypothetical protein